LSAPLTGSSKNQLPTQSAPMTNSSGSLNQCPMNTKESPSAKLVRMSNRNGAG
jgi:hypothetical protein